jgi:hypothetical protein
MSKILSHDAACIANTTESQAALGFVADENGVSRTPLQAIFTVECTGLQQLGANAQLSRTVYAKKPVPAH